MRSPFKRLIITDEMLRLLEECGINSDDDMDLFYKKSSIDNREALIELTRQALLCEVDDDRFYVSSGPDGGNYVKVYVVRDINGEKYNVYLTRIMRDSITLWQADKELQNWCSLSYEELDEKTKDKTLFDKDIYGNYTYRFIDKIRR